MHPVLHRQLLLTRRQLLSNCNKALGGAALAGLMGQSGRALATRQPFGQSASGTHFAPQAKRVIYLFMAGGPSHIDTFDYHPKIREYHGQELPASVRMGQRITGMTSGQSSFPVVAPMFKFKRFGQHGTWVSDALPHVSQIVDDICIVKSVHTEAINHDPAITFINTGVQQPVIIPVLMNDTDPDNLRWAPGSATDSVAPTKTCPRTS